MSKFLIRLGTISILIFMLGIANSTTHAMEENDSIPTLPTPVYDSQVSIEQALLSRRSVREYSSDPLTLGEVSQLLWAAQGLTTSWGGRTAPSAGALYPLEIYLLAGNVIDLPVGFYHYHPDDHELSLIQEGDLRHDLYEVAIEQSAIKDAPIVLVISADYERTTGKYEQRGIQYVHMEVGHVAQNVYLQVESLDLGTVFIGAFDDDDVASILNLDEHEIPLGLMPVGNIP